MFKERAGHASGSFCEGVPIGGTGRFRGSRNGMLSPGKGIAWARHEPGIGSRNPRLNIISFLYIPQLFPRGLWAFLFDTFLYISHTKYKKIHGFYYERICHCAGALFLCFSAPALQGACAAALVLKLFNQISGLEEIKVKIKYEFADGTVK